MCVGRCGLGWRRGGRGWRTLRREAGAAWVTSLSACSAAYLERALSWLLWGHSAGDLWCVCGSRCARVRSHRLNSNFYSGGWRVDRATLSAVPHEKTQGGMLSCGNGLNKLRRVETLLWVGVSGWKKLVRWGETFGDGWCWRGFAIGSRVVRSTLSVLRS